MAPTTATADLSRVLERRRRWRYTPPSLLTYLVGAVARSTRATSALLVPADAVGAVIGKARGVVRDAHNMPDVLVDTQLQQIRAGTSDADLRAAVWVEMVSDFGPIPDDLQDVPLLIRCWPAGRDVGLELTGYAPEETRQLFLERLLRELAR